MVNKVIMMVLYIIHIIHCDDKNYFIVNQAVFQPLLNTATISDK